MGLTVEIFFFQAEDGIRDKLVTGVQTCALPISIRCIVRRCRRLEALRYSRLEICATPEEIFPFISFGLLFLQARISLQQVRPNIRQILTLAMISSRIPGWRATALGGKCPDSPSAAKSNPTRGWGYFTGRSIRRVVPDQTTTP